MMGLAAYLVYEKGFKKARSQEGPDGLRRPAPPEHPLVDRLLRRPPDLRRRHRHRALVGDDPVTILALPPDLQGGGLSPRPVHPLGQLRDGPEHLALRPQPLRPASAARADRPLLPELFPDRFQLLFEDGGEGEELFHGFAAVVRAVGAGHDAAGRGADADAARRAWAVLFLLPVEQPSQMQTSAPMSLPPNCAAHFFATASSPARSFFCVAT